MTTASDFVLDERLASDTVVIGDLALGRVLLMNDSHFPWVILVPRIASVREIYELSDEQQAQLIAESSLLGRTLMTHFNGDKLNVAALGNQVAQLHVHHIVRFQNDAAWPGPIWGKLTPRPYLPALLEQTRLTLAALLDLEDSSRVSG